MTDPLKTLAGCVATQGESLQQAVGEAQVWQVAVLALVRSHPDPAAFAAEFRQLWLRLGSQHQHAELGPEGLAGIAAGLDLLEAFCPAPLDVRPPDDLS